MSLYCWQQWVSCNLMAAENTFITLFLRNSQTWSLLEIWSFFGRWKQKVADRRASKMFTSNLIHI